MYTDREIGWVERNVEHLLGLAIVLGDKYTSHVLACVTDGIDSTEDNAGAIHHTKYPCPCVRLGAGSRIFVCE